jgi:hypothetical protein
MRIVRDLFRQVAAAADTDPVEVRWPDTHYTDSIRVRRRRTCRNGFDYCGSSVYFHARAGSQAR